MRINQEGLDIIKFYESLALQAYLCPAGIWTIGYGHTGPDVKPGLTISETIADALLAQDIAKFEADVLRLVAMPPTLNQFSAFVSFAYNVGSDIDTDTIAEGLGDSTLMKKYNAGDIQGAADEFLKWNKATVAGKRVVLNGLTKRRTAERALFLKT